MKQEVSKQRHHKYTHSFGVYDAYKWIRKNKWLDIPRPLKEHEFYSIVRLINQLLASEVLKGEEIRLPHRMGYLEVRKVKPTLKIVNGKLITSRPVNWQKTNTLWKENELARNKKMLVREESKEVYKVYYNKHNANYNNQGFFKFTPTRSLKVALKERINNHALDAYKLYDYVE